MFAMTLNHSGLQRFRDVRRELIAKRAELLRVRPFDAIAVERMPDAMEELVLANQRDLAIETLARESSLLKQVSEALGRIETGTYGMCTGCGEPIPIRRLAALPWASLCLNCQGIMDREAETDAGRQRSVWTGPER